MYRHIEYGLVAKKVPEVYILNRLSHSADINNVTLWHVMFILGPQLTSIIRFPKVVAEMLHFRTESVTICQLHQQMKSFHGIMQIKSTILCSD